MSSHSFGPFTLDEENRLLLKDGRTVPLTAKTFDLLLMLVRRSGRVVSKEELLRELWSEDEFVEEWNLTQHVYALRKALGDSTRTPFYVETVPRRGFRFIAKVKGGLHAPTAPAPAAATRHPDIRQITFRRGAVFRARFAPGGEVIYGAAFDGASPEVFLAYATGGVPESRPLGFGDADLLAVSSAGHAALSLRERNLRGYVRSGELAMTPIFGGAEPRRLVHAVQEADWDPAGSHLAVVTEAGGRCRLEYPPGKLLYETEGWVSHVRVSPAGRLIAFIDHPIQNDDRGSVAVAEVDGSGVRRLTGQWFSAQGLAWSPSGEEVWFTASEAGNHRALRGVCLDGTERVLYRMAAALTLQDISGTGSVLLVRQNTRVGIIGRRPGEAWERDLSWLDWSLARDLSDDGRKLLFTEAGEGGGADYGVYLRDTGGSSAVRLGDGSALALSPDGRWALSRTASPPLLLTLLSTEAGACPPVKLTPAALNYQQWACWLPGGTEVLFAASAVGRGSQLYTQGVGGGEPRCVTPGVEGVYLTTPRAVSPDGRSVAAMGPDGRAKVFSLESGNSADVPGVKSGCWPIRWGPDGGSLYVYERGEVPAKVWRVDLSTGELASIMELMPPDPAGVVEFLRVLLTPEATGYAYTYTRDLSDLYLLEGLG